MKNARDPIAEFMKEHEDAVKHLHLLSAAAKSLANDGFSRSAFKHVLEGLAYMNEEVREHNKKEEDALFPILERYVEGPTKLIASAATKLLATLFALLISVSSKKLKAESFVVLFWSF